MMNIYDNISGFYEQEPEWDSVIPRNYVEGYIRSLAWSGKTDDELKEIWDDISIFAVYLNNSENFLGDMNRENFIDCIAWVTRNVAGRVADYNSVESFFDNIGGFYQYLGKKKIVRNQQAVSDAKFRMLADNKVNYMDEEGNILPQFKQSNIYSAADLPVKVCLNFEEQMNLLENSMNLFLSKEKYEADFSRADWLFSGCMEYEDWSKLIEGNMDLTLAGLDYYLYDYHMMANDKRPIDIFYKEAKEGKCGEFTKETLDLLEILTEARPIVFTIEESLGDELYTIRDFFSNENYVLLLPFEGKHKMDEVKGVIFYGHIFYNNTMVTRVIQGLPMTKKEQDNLKKLFLRAKDWFTAQESNSGTMDEFFYRHAAVISYFFRMKDVIENNTLKDLELLKKHKFEKHTKFTNIREDEVTKYLDEHLPNETFSARDVVLAKRLWTSFQEIAHVKITRPELWAGAVLWNLGGLNALFRVDDTIIVNMLRELQAEDAGIIFKYGNKIYNVLDLNNFDARYLNEEGLLKKFFTELLVNEERIKT